MAAQIGAPSGYASTRHEVVQQRPSAPGTAALRRQALGNILLVEDEAPVRAFAARALRLRGHKVIEADSAGAALACLAKADAVDLILTDVILPDLDGPTWVREALAKRPDARVVFMSGYAEDSSSEQKALIAGSALLAKPFSLTDLTSLVEQQLAESVPVRAGSACIRWLQCPWAVRLANDPREGAPPNARRNP